MWFLNSLISFFVITLPDCDSNQATALSESSCSRGCFWNGLEILTTSSTVRKESLLSYNLSPIILTTAIESIFPLSVSKYTVSPTQISFIPLLSSHMVFKVLNSFPSICNSWRIVKFIFHKIIASLFDESLVSLSDSFYGYIIFHKFTILIIDGTASNRFCCLS